MDLIPFTDVGTDLMAGIAVVGAALVLAFTATKMFGFVTGWVGKLFNAARGSSGG